MTTLEELTHAIDLGFQDAVSKLIGPLMLDIRQGYTDADEKFEHGLKFCLEAHDRAIASARKLTCTSETIPGIFHDNAKMGDLP